MNKLLTLAGIFCLLFFGAARAQNPTKEKVKVVNRTRSLEVLDVEVSQTSLVLTVRNNYPQRVRGLVVSAQKGSTSTFSTPNRDKMIEPGATGKAPFILSAFREVREVRVLAAVLEDCTMDGDPSTIKKAQADIEAEKALNEKALALLDTTLSGVSPDAAGSLDKLERELSSLADKTARATWEAGYARRVSHSTFVLSKVRDLQKARRADAGVDIREGLLAIKKLLEALRTSC